MPQISPKIYSGQERKASKLRQEGKFAEARETYELMLGQLAVANSPDAFDRAYSAESHYGIALTYIQEALHSPVAARPALLAAANASLVTGLEPLAGRQVTRQYQEPQFTRSSARADTKELSGYRRLCELLIDLHTIAAIKPQHDWDPTVDHSQQIDAYAHTALDVARLALGGPTTVALCMRVVRSAIILGDDSLRDSWTNEAYSAVGLAHHNDPLRATSAQVQLNIQRRDLAADNGALKALGASFGLFEGDEAMLLPAESTPES